MASPDIFRIFGRVIERVMEPTAEESSLLDLPGEDEVTSEHAGSLSFDEEDLLELEFDSKNTETESTLEKKSDFDEDELLQLGREYNQRYANHEKDEALENTEENKTEKAPPEKEESVKRKIIKLNTPSKYNNIPTLSCGRESTTKRNKKFHPYHRINSSTTGRPNFRNQPQTNLHQKPSLLLQMQQPSFPPPPPQHTMSSSQPPPAMFQSPPVSHNFPPSLFKATNHSSLFSKQSRLSSQFTTHPVPSSSERGRTFSLSHLCRDSDISISCDKSPQHTLVTGDRHLLQTHSQSGRFSLSHLK